MDGNDNVPQQVASRVRAFTAKLMALRTDEFDESDRQIIREAIAVCKTAQENLHDNAIQLSCVTRIETLLEHLEASQRVRAFERQAREARKRRDG